MSSPDRVLKPISSCYPMEYYTAIKKSGMRVDCVLTTNYTPFVRTMGVNDTVHLAGELCLFELPQEVRVKDITVEPLQAGDFIFPYLLTQAPVKLIIEPT